MDICRRKSDGLMFRASCPSGYGEADAFVDTLSGNAEFYFLSVRYEPRKWWQFRGRWIDTGEVWEPKSGEFDVLENDHGQPPGSDLE